MGTSKKWCQGCPGSKQPRYTQSFLHHFTTLLTGGSKYERDITVTGSIDPGQPVCALVVAQNLCSKSPVGSIFLKLVKKSHRSLDEMVAGYYLHAGFE